MQIRLFSDLPWIAKLDNQLVDLHVFFINHLLIQILMILSASNDVRMVFQGYVEERN